MKTNKYEKLDQLILNRIGNRYIPFCDIFEGAIFEECDRLTGNEPARIGSSFTGVKKARSDSLYSW